MPPFVFTTWCRQQGRAELGSPKAPYPPFADVDDAELSTAEPAGTVLSPPHAVNVVATNMTRAVAWKIFLKNESKSFMTNSTEQCYGTCDSLKASGGKQRSPSCCQQRNSQPPLQKRARVQTGDSLRAPSTASSRSLRDAWNARCVCRARQGNLHDALPGGDAWYTQRAARCRPLHHVASHLATLMGVAPRLT
jgi:hypothetical protein